MKNVSINRTLWRTAAVYIVGVVALYIFLSIVLNRASISSDALRGIINSAIISAFGTAIVPLIAAWITSKRGARRRVVWLILTGLLVLLNIIAFAFYEYITRTGHDTQIEVGGPILILAWIASAYILWIIASVWIGTTQGMKSLVTLIVVLVGTPILTAVALFTLLHPYYASRAALEEIYQSGDTSRCNEISDSNTRYNYINFRKECVHHFQQTTGNDSVNSISDCFGLIDEDACLSTWAQQHQRIDLCPPGDTDCAMSILRQTKDIGGCNFVYENDREMCRTELFPITPQPWIADPNGDDFSSAYNWCLTFNEHPELLDQSKTADATTYCEGLFDF